MADEFLLEEDKQSVLVWELMQKGYNRAAAEWIADNVPSGFYPGWTAEEQVDWLFSNGILAVAAIPDAGNVGTLTTEEQEQLDAAMRGGIPFGAAMQNIIDSRTPEVVVGSAYNDIMSRYGIDPLAGAKAMAANRAVREQQEQALLEERSRRATEAERQRLAEEEYQKQQRAEAERQRQIAERTRGLAGLAPTRAELRAPFLERAAGVSPAFQRVAGQRLLPDIFEELGMEQKRQQWWETGIKGIAEQLLPETQQEKELMALKRADPWAQLLSQPTFLQQLETRFRGLSPAEKGVSFGRFRPRTRFI